MNLSRRFALFVTLALSTMEELDKLTDDVDFLIFPPELNAAERKHAHEARDGQSHLNVCIAVLPAFGARHQKMDM